MRSEFNLQIAFFHALAEGPDVAVLHAGFVRSVRSVSSVASVFYSLPSVFYLFRRNGTRMTRIGRIRRMGLWRRFGYPPASDEPAKRNFPSTTQTARAPEPWRVVSMMTRPFCVST